MAGISYPLGRFDLLLDMVHHRHRCDEDERRNHLVRVEAGVKEPHVMHTAASVCIISK